MTLIHSRCKNEVTNSFLIPMQESLRASLKSGFEHFLNLHRSQSAELLAKYLDRKLRGEKGVSEADTEALFDKVCIHTIALSFW